MSAETQLVDVVSRMGGQPRPGQIAMTTSVERAIDDKRHLLVEAPTGTGKGLAYLVPMIKHARKTKKPVVVVTATKGLQEQLVAKDLPLLDEHLDGGVTFTLLKGRSNYLCRAKLHSADSPDTTFSRRVDLDDLSTLLRWAESTQTGDQAEAPVAADPATWGAVSVGPAECPGAKKCPFSDGCFSEQARDNAEVVDVVVVNAHLYMMHLLSDHRLLPEHDVVTIDEAHMLADVAADSLGVDMHGGRLAALAARLATLLGNAGPADQIRRLSDDMDRVLDEMAGQRVSLGADHDLTSLLQACIQAVDAAKHDCGNLPAIDDDEKASIGRIKQACTSLHEDLVTLTEPRTGDVAWVTEDSGRSPTLRLAPVDVGPDLRRLMFDNYTVVMTSATLAVAGEFSQPARRVGLFSPDEYDTLLAESPFDYANQAILYVNMAGPVPSAPNWLESAAEQMELLIGAARGRTLGLFTSWRGLNDAASRLRRSGLPYDILVQGELPRTQLIERFRDNESSVLLATSSYWAGIDVPGTSLSLVIIDKLPFPRRNDPLLDAQRKHASSNGQNPFTTVDLPRAAVQLAQGAGRLIRDVDDRGCVAVLDPRLATEGYRQMLLNTMPPMRRVASTDATLAFLEELS